MTPTRPIPNLVQVGARGYRFLLLGALALVTLIAPASAAAVTYCVNTTGCAPAQDYTENQLQAAIDAAAGPAGEDRISIGSGLYDDGPYTAAAGNQVEIFGAGANATTLRGAGNGLTILTLSHVASSVHDLGIELSNGSGQTGLSVRNSATKVRVAETATAIGTRTGIVFTGTGALVDSTVALDPAAGTVAVNAVIPGSTSELTLQNNDLQGATGVNSQTPIHTERNRITARFFGLFNAGPLTIDNASIRMVGNGGPNSAAVQVNSSSIAAVKNGNLEADHLTAFGPATSRGVTIGANCDGSMLSNPPLPASGVVRDTILDGFSNDVAVSGVPCTDPGSMITSNAFATLDIDYSAYDPATALENEPAIITSGPNNLLGVDPQLVNPAAGDLRPLQGSPVIDKGQPTPAQGNERDVAGNPRVQDGNNDGTAVRDMGAFEHTFSATGGGGGDGGGGGGGDGGGTGGTTLTRTLSLGYSDKSDKFKGTLKSNEPACLAGKVKVFEKLKGKDPKAGSDRTNGAGKWSFKERRADGKYYATIPAATVTAGECPAAKSKAKKVD